MHNLGLSWSDLKKIEKIQQVDTENKTYTGSMMLRFHSIKPMDMHSHNFSSMRLSEKHQLGDLDTLVLLYFSKTNIKWS